MRGRALMRDWRERLPTRRAFNSLAAAAWERLRWRGYALSLVHWPVRRALNTWLYLVVERQRMARAAGSLLHWPARRALNVWFAFLDARRRLRQSVGAIATRPARLAAAPQAMEGSFQPICLWERAFAPKARAA